MTPDEFHESVLPRVVAAWDGGCFCASPGFRKLLSFDFCDYGIGPAGLADTEILIDAIIRQRFTPRGEPTSGPGEGTQGYTCPQCGATCTDSHEEFSISMYRSVVTFDLDPAPAPMGLYLVGFYGFKRNEFDAIHDFQQAATVDEFLRQLEIE